MKRSSGPRKTVELSDPIHQQLNMYAFAAGAAGVSVLALTQPSEAKIVYTATHKIIHGPIDRYNLDLNHNGMTDFILTESYSCDIGGCAYFLGAIAARSNNGVAVGRQPLARALRPGARIGFNQHFLSGNRPMVSVVVYSTGKYRQGGYWINVRNRYLGVKFKIKGKFHFGWARLSVKVQKAKITATLTGYAYETIPNKAIIAGQTKGPDDNTIEEASATLTVPASQPATLGMLALGAPALSIWRREELALEGD